MTGIIGGLFHGAKIYVMDLYDKDIIKQNLIKNYTI